MSVMTTPRRNNGRPEACLPCRRRKVACDHARPICSRCIRRKHPDACKYGVSIVSSRQPVDEPLRAASPQINDGLDILPEPPVRAAPRNSEDFTPGYLGFTSFYRTFNEASTSIPASPHFELGNSLNEVSDSPGAVLSLPDPTLQASVAVLKCFPGRQKAQDLLRAHFDPHDGWLRPVAEFTLVELYDTFDQVITGTPSQGQLETLARTISNNTARPFQDDEVDARKWIDQFSGRNTRWETLGILFSYWECGARNSINRDERLMESFQRCVEHCFRMARNASSGANCMVLYLSWKRTVFGSMTAGSANLLCWEYHAESVALLTFAGWHASTMQAQQSPTLASEMRHRINIMIYVGDKISASFTGRPPLMSRRFMSAPLPLDLEDDALLSDRNTLQSAAALLNETEWADRDNLCTSTFLRARAKLTFIREEILELALGGHTTTSADTLRDVKSRAEQVFRDFPRSLQLNLAGTINQDTDAPTLHMRLIAYLEHLQNLFFIERLLIRNHAATRDEILSISYRMVSTTLLYWRNMDRLSALRTDFQWLVMAYAAPGGGILCLELVRPTMTSFAHDPSLSRSNIIQQLSLLVGFLDWGVSIATPNRKLCAACKTIIERVLDHTLNAPPNGHIMDADMLGMGTLNELDFDFNLLDTFDWMPMEMSQPP
ncbi:hypothetical protein BU24DRAFT_420967 [Aaosphaeria arxii CBS 175.79]|uniref:Zn(2)-C6 fungal-type domain-containing protein n=1 Tax=Aaosphaeria arxii CBS 175.79 TaxID=1450172 RepID=A0A6A5XY96_9PLEO|nr:uncharacterized protein BU24DRAFT_420967 [Aaosphaeria arxii CBS 175.79]KAF2017919.1 hypothetical protein BU24DRAFT_420967 [Aaosphaeria arxii CBS 175.79]